MSVELVSLQLRIPRYSAIWVATALLFAVSPLLASGRVSGMALLSTLPFAGILATAATGQTLVVRPTVLGRRFVFAGASQAAARAAGIRVRRVELSTYVLASLAYGGAGILVAGFLRTPGIGAGNDYLLPTIAAVVLGGTSLAGGQGSVLATAGGALFPPQLGAVVLRMGAASCVQMIIPGSITSPRRAVRTVAL